MHTPSVSSLQPSPPAAFSLMSWREDHALPLHLAYDPSLEASLLFADKASFFPFFNKKLCHHLKCLSVPLLSREHISTFLANEERAVLESPNHYSSLGPFFPLLTPCFSHSTVPASPKHGRSSKPLCFVSAVPYVYHDLFSPLPDEHNDNATFSQHPRLLLLPVTLGNHQPNLCSTTPASLSCTDF